MKFLISLTLLFTFHLINAGEASRKEYLELIKKYPCLIEPLGDFTKGEIQILLDPKEMEMTEKLLGRDVGIIARDKYWLWINDACQFPSGCKGIYGRILWTHALESNPGIAVMPVLPNGKIILNCNFRHATRSWEVELPRGGIEPGEDAVTAAKREVLEETGMVVDNLFPLGEVAGDTGLTNSIVPVFFADVVEKKHSQQDETEAIEEILALTIQEIKQAFLNGYYITSIRGEQKKILFRDPFLSYAILLYEIKQR